MGFGWLGTFRQGQWQALRSYVLNERRDVGRRLAVIEAELTRIGKITVYYVTPKDATKPTEQRKGIGVTHGSSLEKLLRAYIALGGNPFDISLFLDPNSTYQPDSQDPDSQVSTQPGDGVVYPKSGDSSLGSVNESGRLSVNKDPANRVGGFKELPEQRPAQIVDQIRGWLNPVITERRHDIEARIIKLMDLQEQLTQEVDALKMAIAGTSGDIPTLDQDFFTPDMGVAKLVAAIDSVFYNIGADGVTPDFASINDEALAKFPSLLSDVTPDEDNTAL